MADINAIKARLRELGISPSLKGYEYAALCIQKLAERRKGYRIMELYSEVAQEFNTIRQRVERSIRTAVLKTVSVTTAGMFASMTSEKSVPTNSDFLFTIADEFKQIPALSEGVQDPKHNPEEEPTKKSNSNLVISAATLSFIEADNDKIDTLIEEYPINIPIAVLADFLNMDSASVRSAIENGKLGLAWRKTGKANHAYHVPTAKFVRWYLNMEV